MIVGLTGGIASGKSTVSGMIKALNIPIVDADVAARQVVEPGQKAFNEIVDTFGPEVLDHNGGLNRAALGQIVFNDHAKRQKLNSIVHPEVRSKMKQDMDTLKQSHPHIVLDIPLLFESKLTGWTDRTLVVYVNKEVQLQRLMERNSYSEEEALSRIRSQLSLAEKCGLADAVIDNNGTLDATRNQLLSILQKWGILQ